MTKKKVRKRRQDKPIKGQTRQVTTTVPSRSANHDLFKETFQRGTKLLHEGQAAESVPYLEEAWRIQPENVDTVINLGGAYILTKQFRKAVVILEPLSRERPDHAQVWINLGAAYLGNPVLAKQEEQERAISAFETALTIDPYAPSVAYNIGLVYRDMGERDKAIAWFRQAIQNNPSDRDARSLLSKLENEDKVE